MTDTLEGIVYGLEESLYHSNPALSSTGARKLLESPARFDYWRKHPEPHKDAFDIGTAVHSKVLGTGWGVIEYPAEHLTDSGKVSTKAATVAWVAEQRAKGMVVVTPSQTAHINGMVDAVLAHPDARELFEQSGNPEASIFATDENTGVDVRARFDFLPDLTGADPWCVDLKTTAKSAAGPEFLKTVANFGYHVQQEWYLHALELVTGEFFGRMKFVVVETYAPYLVAVHELSEQFAEIGAEKGKRARARFAECTAAGIWPGYESGDPLQPPMWAIYEDDEIELKL